MIRKISYLILLLILPIVGFSQNNNVKGKTLKITNKSRLIGNVTIGSSSFDASAVLTITSTTQGALMPRMNTTERDNIPTPTDGLLIFNTQTNQYEFFETTWKSIGGASSLSTTLTIGNTTGSNDVIWSKTGTATSTATQAPSQIITLEHSLFNGAIEQVRNFNVFADVNTGVNLESTFNVDFQGTKLLSIQNSGEFNIGIGATVDIGAEFAIGAGANAGATDAIAIGNGASVTQNDGFAIGNSASVTAVDGGAIGFALASGQGALAIASPDASITTEAGGTFSVAISGRGAKALGANSIAIGRQSDVTASSDGGIAIGKFLTSDANVAMIMGDGFATNSTDHSMAFAFSGTIDYLFAQSADSYLNGGQVGIGFTSPTAKLNIRGVNAASTSDALLVEDNVGTDLFIIENAGDVGINNSDPTAKLHVIGDVIVDSLFSTTTKSLTLGVADATFAVRSNVMIITGDGGGNTITTITGANSGMILTLIFTDGNITIPDDNSHAANTIDVIASISSADDKTLTLVFDGNSWYRISDSTN